MLAFGLDDIAQFPRIDGEERGRRFSRIYGLGYDADLTQTLAYPMLRGKVWNPEGVESQDNAWGLWLDGIRNATISDPAMIELQDFGGSRTKAIDVIGFNSEEDWNSTTYFKAWPIGNSVLLEWSAIPSDSDFYGVILYKSFNGGAYSELATVVNERRYLVQNLAEGQYAFKMLYVDVAGNEGNGTGGDNGYTVSAYVSPAPDAPALVVPELDDIDIGESRQVTFDLTPPADTTGIVAYAYALNQIPLFNDLPYVENAPPYLHVRPITNTSFTFGVCAGVFRVAVYAVNAKGQLSDVSEYQSGTGQEYAFRYILEEGNYLTFAEGSNPQSVIQLTATSVEGGNIRLDFLADVPAAGGIEIYRDGAFLIAAMHNSTGVYTYTDSGLTDGHTYTYKVRPYAFASTGGYGEYSHEVEAVSDATPPAGDQVLTAEVI